MLTRKALPFAAFATFLLFCTFALIPWRSSETHSETRSFRSFLPSWRHSAQEVVKAYPEPPPKVVEFWFQWATLFERAKPRVMEIEVEGKVYMDGGPETDEEDRKPPEGETVGLSDEEVMSMRKSHSIVTEHLDRNITTDLAKSLYKGTGVVIIAGGRFTSMALTSIRMLRHTNSTLPVEIFFQSAEEYEPYLCERGIIGLNAQCYVIEDFLRREQPFGLENYQLKSMALLFSSFAHVLLLDSDQIPVLDPRLIIDSEVYKQKGFISWPDYWPSSEDPTFYNIAGLPSYPKGLPLRASESGQLIVNKLTHLDSLLLACYYNVFGPKYFYPLLSQGAWGQGDKETFLAAAVVRNATYYRVRTKIDTVGHHNRRGDFFGAGMIQHDPIEDWALRVDGEKGHTTTRDARAFFVHANKPKMDVANLLGDNDGRQLEIPDLEDDEGRRVRTRLWGPRDDILEKFPEDIEKATWREMVTLACEMERAVREFRKVKNLCRKAKEHWDEVFAETEAERWEFTSPVPAPGPTARAAPVAAAEIRAARVA